MSQVPLADVQAALVRVFHRWGQPRCIRVDNGLPFGEPGSDIVPVLALWLIGLGIDVLWNRVRQPTDNAKVERMQGVTSAWAEPGQCVNAKVLEAHLEEVARIQRSLYRCRRLGGRRRAEVYPGLLSGGRRYDAGGLDLDRVFAFLAQGTWVRKVSKAGQVNFYDQRWQVGAAYRRQYVCIGLDLPSRSWIVSDEQGREITRIDASFIAGLIQQLSRCLGTEGG